MKDKVLLYVAIPCRYNPEYATERVLGSNKMKKNYCGKPQKGLEFVQFFIQGKWASRMLLTATSLLFLFFLFLGSINRRLRGEREDWN
jgi:hypothetical protein